MPSRFLQRQFRHLKTVLPLLFCYAVVAGASAQVVDKPKTLYLIAGGPQRFLSPDGIGPRASFLWPMGIVSTGTRLWVVDKVLNSLRSIDLNGKVETVVGSAAVCGSNNGGRFAARVCRPVGLAIDPAGALYIADSLNSTIRKFDGDQVSTMAGIARLCSRADNPAGNPFCVPIAVTADSGNLYVADAKSELYRIDLATGAATKIAGTRRCGSTDGPADIASFCTPQGIAIDRTTGVLYVADTTNQTIRKVTPEGEVSTFAGKAGECGSANGRATARFCAPSGIIIDPAGNLYVIDRDTSLVRKITPDRLVSTLTGRLGTAETKVGALPGAIARPLAIALIGENRLAVTTESGESLGINF